MDPIPPSVLQPPPPKHNPSQNQSTSYNVLVLYLCLLVFIVGHAIIHFLMVFYNKASDPDSNLGLGQGQESQETPKSRINGRLLVAQGTECADCMICLEDFQQGEICWALASCNHLFHLKCVTLWVQENNTCPICRKSTDLVAATA